MIYAPIVLFGLFGLLVLAASWLRMEIEARKRMRALLGALLHALDLAECPGGFLNDAFDHSDYCATPTKCTCAFDMVEKLRCDAEDRLGFLSQEAIERRTRRGTR